MTKIFKGVSIPEKLLVSYARSFNHPFKIRLVNLLIRLLYPSGLRLRSHYGGFFKVSPTDYIGFQLIYTGAYESETLNLFVDLLGKTKNAIMIDVGANIGLYSIACVEFENINIYSIEPTAQNFWKLQQNFALNPSMKFKKHLINVGLSDVPDLTFISNPNHGNNGTFRIEEQESNKGNLISVTTLDSIITKYQIKHIDMLKMDVEGYEGKVLDGFKLIEQIKPRNIIMEFSDYVERVGNSKKAIYDYLVNLGYDAFTIDRKSMIDFDNIPENNIWFKLK